MECEIRYNDRLRQRVDPFTADGLFDRLRHKPDFAAIGFTTDGGGFGGFNGAAATRPDRSFNDPDVFMFPSEPHGQGATPQWPFVWDVPKDRSNVRIDDRAETGSSGFGTRLQTLGNTMATPSTKVLLLAELCLWRRGRRGADGNEQLPLRPFGGSSPGVRDGASFICPGRSSRPNGP